MSKCIDLTGQKFGRLIVVKRVENDKSGNLKWLCQCNCDDKNEIIILGGNLVSGHTKSCGCLAKTNALKHGHNRKGKTTRTYRSWHMMIQRCTNPNYSQYKDYGGRKIKIHKRWMKFSNFLIDMCERPLGHTLERRENDKGYCKKNCYWATWEEQARNRRNNRLITCFGKTQLLIEWSEETKIPYFTLRARIYKLGWSLKEALTTPVGERRKKK